MRYPIPSGRYSRRSFCHKEPCRMLQRERLRDICLARSSQGDKSENSRVCVNIYRLRRPTYDSHTRDLHSTLTNFSLWDLEASGGKTSSFTLPRVEEKSSYSSTGQHCWP